MVMRKRPIDPHAGLDRPDTPVRVPIAALVAPTAGLLRGLTPEERRLRLVLRHDMDEKFDPRFVLTHDGARLGKWQEERLAWLARDPRVSE